MTRRSRSTLNLDRRLSSLETDAREEYPEAGLIRIAAAERAGECEGVAGEPGLIRCFGDVYRVSPTVRDALADTAGRSDP